MSDSQPPLATLADELRAVTVRLLAYLCGIAGLAIMAAEIFAPPPVAVALEPEVRPEWATVERPWPAFELNLPEIDEEPRYTIRRHTLGGGRKDILAFGELGKSLRFVLVEIYRPGTESQYSPDASGQIATLVDGFNPVGDMRVSLPLDTKFGPFTTVDMAVGRFGGGHCVGFVQHTKTAGLRIAGVSCSMDAIVDREGVACVLDKLTLLSAGSDRKVAEYFAHGEVNRKFCGQRDPLMYATPKRPMPNDHSAVNLRGTLAAR